TYVRATGTRNITGTAVTTNYQVTPSWTVLNGTDTSRVALEIDFPHVPNGGNPAWTSMVGLNNLWSGAQVGTLTFTPHAGSPIAASRFLSANGSLFESAQSLFGLSSAYQDGWVKVTASGPISGFIFYSYAGTAGATTVAGQSTARTRMMFDHVATGPLWN